MPGWVGDECIKPAPRSCKDSRAVIKNRSMPWYHYSRIETFDQIQGGINFIKCPVSLQFRENNAETALP